MAGYPNIPNGQFLPSPTSGYSPRTPPPQRGNIPPAVSSLYFITLIFIEEFGFSFLNRLNYEIL